MQSKAKDETIQHIVSGCSFLANGEYKRRHNNICEQLHWNILASHNLTKESHWWKHQPAPVIENENIKVLYDFDVRTDKVISACRPDIMLVSKVRKTAQIIDVACPNDINVFEKEQEKVTKYQDLKIEIEKMWSVKAEVIPVVVGVLGAVTKRLESFFRSFLIAEKINITSLQKSALLGTAHILRLVLQLPGSR